MGSYKRFLTNQYSINRYANDPSQHFDFLTTNLMDMYYDQALGGEEKQNFKAVCLSGIRTDDNNGSGVDQNDAVQVGDFLRVKIRRLDSYGSCVVDPLDFDNPSMINQAISINGAVMTAESDYTIDQTNAPMFGQTLECYKDEEGKIRFMNPGPSGFQEGYEALSTIEGVYTTLSEMFKNGFASLLGDSEDIGGDIYTKAQRLRDSGVKIRKKAIPPKSPGDEALAAEAGIPVNVMRAFRLIESVPKGPSAIRFEPHLWYRDLQYDPPNGFTRNEEVVYSKVPSETNKSAFLAAYAINKEIATKSTSFGLYQVLGGIAIKEYGSAESFWTAFTSDPLEASNKLVVAWFKSNKSAVSAANSLNFTKLAELYNGKQQAKHYYDALLAEAYKEAEQKYG